MMGAMGDYMAEKTREIVKIDLANIADDENNDFEVTGGTTNLVGDTTLTDGESLTIKATPEEGYIFSQWLVNGEVNTNNPFVITAIDQDYSIEPIFTKEEMAVQQTTIQNAAQKYMHNGVLYIRRGENVYDAQGKRVEQ